MRGRQVFMDSLVAHGVDAIFGNPGTTENPLLDSLVDYPGIRYFVALHEGVATCAASYYTQASGKSAVVNLHVAPGLGNGIGMMYGALKACSPLVVTAGQQDTRMRLRDPVLRHDTVAMAEPVSKWAVEPQHADEIGPVMRRAFRIANDEPHGPVFVSLPVNVMAGETDITADTSGLLYAKAQPDPDGIERLAQMLLASRSPAIVAGDDVARQGGNDALTKMAERSGAAVYREFLRMQLTMANQHPNFRGRVPSDASSIRELLGEHDFVLLIGGPFFEEVWFDQESPFMTGTAVAQIEAAEERLAYNFSLAAGVAGHIPSALALIIEALNAGATPAYDDAARTRNAKLATCKQKERDGFIARVARQSGDMPIPPACAMAALAAAIPNDAVIVDETITAADALQSAFELNRAGDYFNLRGGGIGQGVAGALGVAVANPERPVIAMSGDGSAMYSIQALWTAAHHGLNIVFVIFSNREYRVLKHNLDIYRQRFNERSDKPYPHMDLSNPELGFADLARGMGVRAQCVERLDDVQPAVVEALRTKGPYLIDLVVAGKP